MTHWTFAGASAEGDPFEIAPGLNVWAHEWLPVENEPVYATDPLYGSDHEFRVYEIAGRDGRIRFAARELSARLWGFYVPEEE